MKESDPKRLTLADAFLAASDACPGGEIGRIRWQLDDLPFWVTDTIYYNDRENERDR